MDRNVIPAIRRCIYCLRDNVPLGREHVVPEGLGGKLIILKASCPKCAEAIRKFEQPCIRRTFESLRTYFRVKSKPKHKPRKRDLWVGAGEPETWSVFDSDDYPFAFALPVFDLPPLLSGVIKADDKVLVQKLDVWISPVFGAKMAALGGMSSVFTPFEVGDLFRLLAKIGHGFGVAECGLSGFVPLATNFIRGIPDGLSNSLVGRAEEQLPKTGALHELAIRKKGEYVTALVKLFAPIDPPTYEVVIGRRLLRPPS